jgi:peptide/nickel transport system substrate-binding protein
MMGTKIRLAMMATAIAMTFTAAQAATLRVGMQDDPDALDPATSGTYAGRIVFSAMCDKLVDIDAKLEIVPQLATAWTWNTEGTEVTFTLREGVKFQDGTPLDAEAVKFNIERMKSMQDSKRKGELSPIDSVTVVDANNVTFKLKSAFAPLLAVLSDRAGMMVSPAAAAEGKEFSANPVCAGPFKFKERRARDVISLEKFQDYWNADEIGYDEIQYLYIPDSTVRLSRLQAGDLEISERIAPTDLAAVRGNQALALHTSPGLAVSHLMINVGNDEKGGALGKDARLRQAFELSIDRDVINKVAFAGEFAADNQMIPPSSVFYSKGHPAPARDIDKAKALIEEVGGDAPVVEITYENSLADGRVAQIIQSMAGEAGFQVELVPLETASAVERYLAGNFQAYIGNWSGRADPDPTLFSFFGTEGSQNVNKYSNPEMDQVLIAARQSADVEERKALYEKATGIYLADLPTIPLYHPNWFYAARANVDGVAIYPDGLLRLTGVKPAN